MIKQIVIIFLFLVLTQVASFADVIHLKSGSSVEGVIETETDDSVTVVVNIGKLTYPKALIESISKSSTEDNAKLKEKWKAQKEQSEKEQEQQRKFAAEQEAKGLVLYDGKWITKDEYENLTKPKAEEKKEVTEEKPLKLTDTITFYDNSVSYKYAVRLPPKYNTKTKWPVLFCFDPNGNGEEAAKRFAYAADNLGWIVVGSLDAKNGPWEPIISAQEAMLKDIPKRFKVDEKRFYAAGFSGGARMSFLIAYSHPTQFKGVIACGAGFPDKKHEIAKNVAVYLCIGRKDGNMTEIQQVYTKLDADHVKVYKQEFEGVHQWPPSGVIQEALDWIAKQ